MSKLTLNKNNKIKNSKSYNNIQAKNQDELLEKLYLY